MKQIDDTLTIDILDDMKISDSQRKAALLLKSGRGRPVTGSAMTPAERKAAQRARQRESGVGQFTVDLPLDLIEQFDAFLKFKDLTKSEVLEKLIRTQLLRKR